MNAKYLRQAGLVIRVIPHIATEGVFALKGGTAINLFELDMPRLSVDIDLCYAKISDRISATSDINDVKKGFLVCALSHNRPLHEVLNPILQDHRDLFDQQFVGMTDLPFTYEEHCETFEQLRIDVLKCLDDEDRGKLLDFVSLKEGGVDFGVRDFDKLPAIAWKRRNLATLRVSNPGKFAEQRERLLKLFA